MCGQGSMHLVLSSASVLKRVVDVCKEIAGHGKIVFNFDASGLYVQAFDMSRVCLLVVRMPAETFKEFSMDGHDQDTLCLDVLKLQKTLKFFEPDANVLLDHPAKSDTITLTSRGDKSDATFTLSMLYATEDETMRFEVPEEPRPTAFVARFNASELAKLIKDLGQFGDSVTIFADAEMTLCVKNTDGMEARARVFHEAIVQAPDQPKSVSVAVSYMTSIFKFTADVVHVEVDSDQPTVFHFPLETEGGFVRAYLAPKVTDDGDEPDE